VTDNVNLRRDLLVAAGVARREICTTTFGFYFTDLLFWSYSRLGGITQSKLLGIVGAGIFGCPACRPTNSVKGVESRPT